MSIDLDESSLALRGSLFPDTKMLSLANLSGQDVSEQRLASFLRDEIAQFAAIQVVSIGSSSSLTNLAPLDCFQALEVIHVAGRRVSSLTGADLPHLKVVTITDCPKLELGSIGALKTLSSVTLEGRSHSDLPSLLALPNLRQLELHRQRGNALEVLDQTAIAGLKLSAMSLESMYVGGLKGLRHLMLQTCRMITGLSGCSEAITSLDVDGCPSFNLQSVRQLPKLMHLHFRDRKNDFPLGIIGELPDLQELFVSAKAVQVPADLALPPNLRVMAVERIDKSTLKELRSRNAHCRINDF